MEDGALRRHRGRPSTPALAARLAAEGITLADGQRAEICLALDGWIAAAAAGLARGVLLLIDYGHPAAELYDPAAAATGTLAAYLGHRSTTIRTARSVARTSPRMSTSRPSSGPPPLPASSTSPRPPRAAFLAGLGAGDLLVALQTGPEADLRAYLEASSALVRMIDPAAMGGFAVMAFGRGLPDGTRAPGTDPTTADRT